MVKRLGEILVGKGLMSQDALRTGLEACRRNGGRLGTWLVRLNLISEERLLDALWQQTGCPPASSRDLSLARTDVRALIPEPFAKRNLIVAFGRRGRYLDVAMANPNDLLAVDEIAKVTGLTPRPHVATEAAIMNAFNPASGYTPQAAAPVPVSSHAAGQAWREFWKLESSPAQLMDALCAPVPNPPASAVATFPTLLPVETGPKPAAARDIPELSEALSAVTHRSQVAELVLGYLASAAYRVAIFSVYQGNVMGWEAVGPAIVEEDFHAFVLPLNRPSLFLNLTSGVQIHVGPLGSVEGKDLLLDALGSPAPQEAVVVPVRVRGKAVAFLWLDQGEASVADVHIQNVQETSKLAGLALEILVLRQKVKTGARLTEGGGPD
jgi:hypothetical protein